jgi:large subunit ribosomal protein L25
VYWKKQEPISVKVDYVEFLKLFRISWVSRIIDLVVDWNAIEVLVHEVIKEPIKWDYQHIDFYAITKGEKLTANIRLSFVGTAEALVEWAIIEEHIKEVEVKVLPKDLVDSIEVDLSALKHIWDVIRVSDLSIDKEKFTIINNADEIVAIASKPREEKIEDTAPIIAPADVPATEQKTPEETATAEWDNKKKA